MKPLRSSLPPFSRSAIQGANRFRFSLSLALATFALPCGVVWAAATDAPTDLAPSAGVAGLGIVSVPKFQGAEQSKIKVVPIFEYHWANGVFAGGQHDTVVGWQGSTPSQVQYGVALGIEEGRKVNRIEDVPTRGVLVAFSKIPLTQQLSFDSSVRSGAGNDQKGTLIKLGGTYRIALNPSTQLRFSLAGTAANQAYAKSYFGVSPTQSRSSGYAAYMPSGRLLDTSVGIQLFHQIDRDFSFLAGVSISRLGDLAANSPLAQKRSQQKAFFGFARAIGPY